MIARNDRFTMSNADGDSAEFGSLAQSSARAFAAGREKPGAVRAKLRPIAAHRARTISPALAAFVMGMAVAVFLVGLLVGRMF